MMEVEFQPIQVTYELEGKTVTSTLAECMEVYSVNGKLTAESIAASLRNIRSVLSEIKDEDGESIVKSRKKRKRQTTVTMEPIDERIDVQETDFTRVLTEAETRKVDEGLVEVLLMSDVDFDAALNDFVNDA